MKRFYEGPAKGLFEPDNFREFMAGLGNSGNLSAVNLPVRGGLFYGKVKDDHLVYWLKILPKDESVVRLNYQLSEESGVEIILDSFEDENLVELRQIQEQQVERELIIAMYGYPEYMI